MTVTQLLRRSREQRIPKMPLGRCQSANGAPDDGIIKIQTSYNPRAVNPDALLAPNRRRFSDVFFQGDKLNNPLDLKVISVSTKNPKSEHDQWRAQSSSNVGRKQSADIDFLVFLYSRRIRDNLSAGISDFRFSMGSMIYSEPNTAVISTTYDHARNIFHLRLISTKLHLLNQLDKNRKIYATIAFYAGKIQHQKTKRLPLEREINWQTPFRFKHLTMRQLETGTMRLQFFRCSRFGFNRTILGEAKFVLHRHHYRKSHFITLVVES